MPISNPKEEIDIRILRLIGLEDVFDLDYDTYLTLLKEAMVRGRMPKSSIPTEEVELLTDEYKRVKTKKDQGRFSVKSKKIGKSSFNVGATKKLIGSSKGGAIVPSKIISKSPLSKGLEDSISAVASTISSIADTLKEQQRIKNTSADYDRRKSEQEKRATAESKLEKRFEGLKKAAEKIISPVKSLLDRILEFFTNIILGRIVYKIVEWMGNPENASKVKSVIRFLGDWWPALLGSYILFGNSFSGLIRGTLGMVARFTLQLARVAIPSLARFITSNPLIAAGVVTGLAAGGAELWRQGEEKKQIGAEASKRKVKPEVVQRELNKSKASPFALFGQGMSSAFFGGGLAKFSGGGFAEGYVSGEKGVDKVPAMLSDGEFVMSRGAVEKYGVDTLEAMNAAGGGTNKPKIMGGKVYAKEGGYIGDTVQKLREDINNYLKGKGGGPNFDIGNPRTWIPGGGGTSVSGGGGTGAFLRGMGFVGRAASQVPRIAGNTLGPGLSYLQRASGEVGKRLSPSLSYAQRAAGSAINKIGSTVKGIPGLVGSTVSGLKPVVSATSGAAQEAVPAVLGSILGLSRTDTSISEDMQRQILQARQTALKKGRKFVEYEDYAGGGRFSGAGLTMGRIGDREFKRDAQGRIIGLRQVYDTDTTVDKAMGVAKSDLSRFGSSVMKGNPNFKALMGAIYKPVEALLAASQDRGKTLHDINFDEKVLGFKPGKEVLNQTQKNMIAAQKNREALQNKRPWWDKMGLFGGASAEMKRQRERESNAFSASAGYGRYTPGPSQRRIKPVSPPVSRKPRVVYGPPVPTSTKRKGGGRTNSKPPRFSASTKGMRSKIETLGMMR